MSGKPVFGICCLFAIVTTSPARAAEMDPDGGTPTRSGAVEEAPDGGSERQAGDSSDVCKLDPEACPKLDFSKEGARMSDGVIYAEQSASYVSSPSAKTASRIVMPTGHIELGGEMVFVTSASLPAEEGRVTPAPEVRFTDLVLARFRARRSFSDWLELFGSTELLAKQPVETEESVWQGALIGAHAAFTKHFAAALDATGGPLLRNQGLWWQVEPGIVGKFEASRELRFGVNLGSPFTALDYKDGTKRQVWLEELASGVEADLGDRDGALWVRIDYYVPLAKNPTRARPDPQTGRFLDPQVRVNLQVGGVLSLHEGWDVFATYTFVDRGELDKPATTLPILDGGFDQQQLALGVEYRFDPRPKETAR